ncbi:MAG: hypothetical protein J6B68_10115 [Lachnospiraceae bacterium]|nr:hypothetical protein [Lachnospiraceae bacterium]
MMLTISQNQKKVIVMINEKHTVAGTLRIMADSGIIEGRKKYIVRSQRTKERLQTEKTYEENHIYNGDTLILQ